MARRLRSIGALAAAGAATATLLSGCQLIEANTPVYTPTALEACAIDSTWQLDTELLGPVATTVMRDRGLDVDVTVEGSQTLTWDADFTMRFATDLTFTGTVPSQPGFQERFSASGTSEGMGYFSGDVVVPRKWTEDGLTVATTATQDDAAADVTFRWPPLWVDDTAGLHATCSGEQLTLTARQGHLAWTFNRVG